MSIDQKTADRMWSRAQAMEEGVTVPVLASRPSGRPLEEMVLAHERRQFRLRTLIIASQGLALLTSVVTVAKSGSLLQVVATSAPLLVIGIAAAIASVLLGRAFARQVRDIGTTRSARTHRAAT